MHRASSLFLLFALLFSCTPAPSTPPQQTALYVYRFSASAFVQFSPDLQALGEIPFSIPPQCGLFNTFPAPLGRWMAVELSCPNGQTVLFLDTDTAAITQPVTDADSHFLAWAPDGSAAYLKVDSLGSPSVVRAAPGKAHEVIPITEFTYDLAVSTEEGQFAFTFSRGMGQGSELWLAKRNGKTTEQLYADTAHYLSFARYSPDGRQIAFIKIPDTSTPFTVGELWVMDADGSNARKLADADAGHGYAANWSPDGKRIAFVVRENPQDERADQAGDALISNIYVAEVESGALTQITSLETGRAETPFWSPTGNMLAFSVVINDRMDVQIADLRTGEIQSPAAESVCCPAWMRK